MQTHMIHVTLGDQFENLYIKARDRGEAISKARAKVASCARLALFRNRFTNFAA